MANTTGSGNVAIGVLALQDNTTGVYNTAIGVEALANNTTGVQNTAIGQDALKVNTTGDYNTAIGYLTLTANTTGNYNVGIAPGALTANTTGQFNIAIGTSALKTNSTGTKNIALGHEALKVNSTGIENVAMGYKALTLLATGLRNSAIGFESLIAAEAAATGNSAFGAHSGGAISSGDYNTCIGETAGMNLTSGDENIAIGHDSTLAAAVSNQIAIGTLATVTAQYGIAIGNNISAATNDAVIGKNGATITVDFDADGTWAQASDIRKKRNINDDSLGLSFINELKTKTYQWKPAEDHPEEWGNFTVNEEGDKVYADINTDVVMHGLIAQDVKKALDNAGCNTFGGWGEDENGMQEVSKTMFVIPLIKAVQELTKRVKELESK